MPWDQIYPELRTIDSWLRKNGRKAHVPNTIGIDTGGTFTDLVAISADGVVRVAKHPSTPEAPMRAFLGVLEKSEIPFEAIERIVHGTTVATNAILQRTGANVVFITTAGFEDVPFIQRINRKKEVRPALAQAGAAGEATELPRREGTDKRPRRGCPTPDR